MVFTTRAGGVSAAPYESFNLGEHVGDDPRSVAANRARLAGALGLRPPRLVWMEQVHSRNVTVVDGPVEGPVEVTDALVTSVPDLALVVLTADCVPMLLADEDAGVIGAVHAGRIGARIGIVPRAIEAMVGLGARPERIGALLGPAACGGCYEVPPHMQADVEEHLPGSACRTRKGTTGLDIRAGVARQLGAAGVESVVVDPRCTIEERTLFSHRRGAPTGRLAGVVWSPSAGGAS
ncbi:peptidoglycan editing factor PgeF [Tomitella fengzijianii]|uniref:Purine nucleoside phosphorylase n=1 Tax=Tomitella fengzijianii TaxID=2597660 RepID=A0A516X476_9ACTN|nr:peptidoglycan editing factor PgeF [Tomitella fengzijianii]QDQ97864.1 peptidoglycan editing factor PgeF [Tomitella fengzijianii]